MATELQLMANRLNALLSTGPHDTSRTRFNGLKHGLRSSSHVIFGENAEEYESLKNNLKMELQPKGLLQEHMVEKIAFNLLRLKRAARAEKAVVNAHLGFGSEDEIDWANLISGDLLGKISKYENHALRQICKLLEELRKFQGKE